MFYVFYTKHEIGDTRYIYNNFGDAVRHAIKVKRPFWICFNLNHLWRVIG